MRKHRWYQFSLASGLVVLLLVCISLAWWRDHTALRDEANRKARLAEMLLEEPEDRQYAALEVGNKSKFESPDQYVSALRNKSDWFLSDSLAARDPAIGQAAIPKLIQLLSAEKEETRVRAANVLGHLSTRAEVIVPALLGSFDDSDRRFHYSIVSALGEMGPNAKEALPVLREALTDPGEPHQASVAMAIWKIDGDPNAVDTLVKRLTHNNSQERIIAADYLRLIGPEDTRHAVPALMQARTDSDPTVRQLVLSSLVKLLPSEDALNLLADAGNDDDPHVRRSAAALLRSLAK